MVLRSVRLLILGGFVLILAGCSHKPRADISGTITYEGRLLPFGRVTFMKDNLAAAATINHGKYKVLDAPIGDAIVLVQSDHRIEMLPPGEKPFLPEGTNYIPIPRGYGDPKTTVLKYKIVDGEHIYDLELKDYDEKLKKGDDGSDED